MTTNRILPTGYDLNVGNDFPGFLDAQAATCPTPEPIGHWSSFDRDGYRYGQLVSKDAAQNWVRKLPDGKWIQIVSLPRPITKRKAPWPTKSRPAWAGNIAQQKRTKH